jgi:PAS domain S-box-containing protein
MSNADDIAVPSAQYRDLEKKLSALQSAYDQLLAEHEAVKFAAQSSLVNSDDSRGSALHKDFDLLDAIRDYRDLFNLNPVPMWIYDYATFQFIEVNEAAVACYGYQREEFLSMTISDIRPASERERLLVQGRQVTDAKRSYRGYWKHQKKNGAIIHAEVTAQLVSYGGRKAILVLSNDITEKISAESNLIRSNRKLQAAQQIAQVGYWELDLATLQISLSEQSRLVLGLDPRNKDGYISFEEFYRMIHPDDRTHFDKSKRDVLSGKSSVMVEHRVILPNGEIKHLLEKGNLVFDPTGKPMIFEGIVQDVTDRKKTQEKIAENERRMKNAQYVGSVGDWEYNCKTAELTWSDELFRLFARDPREGAPSLEEFIKYYDTPAGNGFRKLITRALFNAENYEADLHLNLASTPEAYQYAAGLVSKDEEGNVVKLYGIVQDITVRKLAEIRLNAEHRQLRTLIDTLPDSIYIKDREGRKIVANKVDLEIMRTTEEDALGKTDVEIFGHEVGAQRYAEDLMIISTGKPLYNHEEVFMDSNGTPIWLLTSKVPLRDLNGEVTGLLGVGRIITERKESEQALQASNERFNYVTRATSDAIWDWDIINDHLYWGEGYEKIFGYHLVENKTNQIHSFDNIHPEDKVSVFEGINKLLRSDATNWSHEYRYKRADGQYVYVFDKALVVRDENGRAIRMIGAMQDISERKEAIEAIRKTQEKFTSLVNTIDGIVWEADAESFRFTYVSRHAEILLGYPAEEWIKDPSFWAQHIHPDDRDEAVRFCVEQTRLKKQHQFEYRMLAADGSIVWVADFVTFVDGSPSQLRGVMVDITERKKAEQELADERMLLRILIDNLPDYIYVKDENLRHVINNRANVALLGFEHEDETINKTIVDLLGPQMAAEFLKDDQQVLATGLPIIEREEPIFNSNGEKRWLLTTKIPFRDENNHPKGLVGISRDITDRKKTAEELVEKNEQLKNLSNHLQQVREEERKRLAREVHDELGQLASVVKMDIDWLSLRLTDVEELPRKRIQHASDTADLLINTVRKIAAMLRPSMLDELGLNASIAWQCRQFTLLNGIPCVFDQFLDDDFLPVSVKTELFRICQESLTNIMRHAKASRVTVTLKESGGDVELRIIDDGAGFDTKARVTTLGLIGMRERAISVNGKLVVDSAPGKGTSVSVTIPAQP